MYHIFNIVCCLVCLAFFSSCGKSDKIVYDAATMEDLKGHTVAAMTGSMQEILLSSHYPEVVIKEVNLPVDAITMVRSHQADYMLVDNISFLNVDLAADGLQYNFEDTTLGGAAGLAFPKDSVALAQQFNDFLARAKAEGLYDEMVERWSSKCLDTVQMPQIAIPHGAPVEVAVCQSDMPMSYIAFGDWAGFEIEMLQRFGLTIGRPMHFSGYDFSAIIASLTSGKAAIGAAFMNITPERQQKVLFSDPFWYSKTVCVSRISNASSHKSFATWVRDGIQNNLIQENRWKLLLMGLQETLIISFWALLLGTFLGGIVCFLRMCRSKLCNGFARVYVDIMRGVPILVFLMIMFYVVFAKAGISATLVAILAFAFNLAAYVSEIFRSAVMSVDKGQWEAGWALGFSRVKTFLFIIAPQAIRHALPVYKGEAVSLIKNTSIVGYIAIQDLTKMSDVIRSRTFDAFFPLIVVTLIYFLMAWLLGIALDALFKERRKQ